MQRSPNFQKGDLICEVNGKPFQNLLHRDAVDFLLNCDTKLAISYQVAQNIFYYISLKGLSHQFRIV
jgi:hypothetical protein